MNSVKVNPTTSEPHMHLKKIPAVAKQLLRAVHDWLLLVFIVCSLAQSGAKTRLPILQDLFFLIVHGFINVIFLL